MLDSYPTAAAGVSFRFAFLTGTSRRKEERLERSAGSCGGSAAGGAGRRQQGALPARAARRVLARGWLPPRSEARGRGSVAPRGGEGSRPLRAAETSSEAIGAERGSGLALPAAPRHGSAAAL